MHHMPVFMDCQLFQPGPQPPLCQERERMSNALGVSAHASGSVVSIVAFDKLFGEGAFGDHLDLERL